ncbi:hypothetical protein [Cyanobacterium sp. Dongsha4]|uniref:hypothetical protein n=1 Tax=Cyanobacterium sp. DS4 TaxID=2878255 RepID=UPI002E824560|nr:hypothetical protein [Cyanobacterium sp. Dongsha4]WVL00726.1 hypothetical protein Dongsha4_00575 [Cyanobacterium sp. Dongsha4]
MASSTSTHTGVIRQGDVLIIPWEKLPVNKSVKLPNLTLAKGEVTGHSHRISEGKAELYERNGILFLRILSPTAKLQHDEHHALNIPKGDWMVRIQREYRPISPLDDNNNSNVNLTSKTTLSQKNTLIDSSDHSTEKQDNPLKDDLTDLANKVDFKYWDKLVEDAEKRKEYLERIQANKDKFNHEYSDNIEGEKSPIRKRKIRYVEAKRESLNDYVTPPSPTKKVSSSSPSKSDVNEFDNWIDSFINHATGKRPKNWIDVVD